MLRLVCVRCGSQEVSQQAGLCLGKSEFWPWSSLSVVILYQTFHSHSNSFHPKPSCSKDGYFFLTDKLLSSGLVLTKPTVLSTG